MKAAACARTWEAAALDERRLAGADRDSFARHSERCRDCRAELAAQQSLRSAVLGVTPRPLTSLAHRRARGRLLEHANEQARGRRAKPKRLVFAVLAAALVAATITAVDHARSSVTGQASVAVTAPRFDAQSSPDARWRPQTTGATTRVELTNGAVAFTVPHLQAPQRFFLTLPDGEIEVHGTAFRVAVDDGHTTAVTVTTGVVALRLRGSNEVSLHEGEAWPKAVIAAATTAAVAQAPAPHAAREAAPPRAAASMPAPSGASFDRAFSDFEKGNYGIADLDFESFMRDFPSDARTEDAAYLRAVARFRLGDRDGAAQLARTYLQSYPTGLRRPEAQRIADQPSRQ